MGDDTGHDTSALPVTVRWSAAKAARETGAARSTILAALQSGRLEGTKDEAGAWQITPQALGAAGFTAGKPTPPDPVQLEDQDDDAARLRLELAEARADARVAGVERDAERRLREAAERERDLYMRMLEAPPVPATDRPQTAAQPEVDPLPTPESSSTSGAGRSKAGRLRRAWNIARFG